MTADDLRAELLRRRVIQVRPGDRWRDVPTLRLTPQDHAIARIHIEEGEHGAKLCRLHYENEPDREKSP